MKMKHKWEKGKRKEKKGRETLESESNYRGGRRLEPESSSREREEQSPTS